MQINSINNTQNFGVSIKFPMGFKKALNLGDSAVAESLTKIAEHQSEFSPYKIQKMVSFPDGENLFVLKNSINKTLVKQNVEKFDAKATNSFIKNIAKNLGKISDIDNNWSTILKNTKSSEQALETITNIKNIDKLV